MARTATVAPAAPGEPEAGSAGGPEETSRAARLAAPLWPAALAAGTVWLGFDASGYFAVRPAGAPLRLPWRSP